MQIEPLTRQQLRGWWGDEVSQWTLLQTYRISFGLPKTDIDSVLRTPIVAGRKNTYVCGDHMETPSIEGTMNSGIRVADLILSERQTTS
jgi:predicted NAD/FAD-dependent oxidoreductase